jgi:hypothetical protein
MPDVSVNQNAFPQSSALRGLAWPIKNLLDCRTSLRLDRNQIRTSFGFLCRGMQTATPIRGSEAEGNPIITRKVVLRWTRKAPTHMPSWFHRRRRSPARRRRARRLNSAPAGRSRQHDGGDPGKLKGLRHESFLYSGTALIRRAK